MNLAEAIDTKTGRMRLKHPILQNTHSSLADLIRAGKATVRVHFKTFSDAMERPEYMRAYRLQHR